MDGKVILTLFGVVLLLAAIFFFFKSFASHEQRMQEEQRMRVELERKKLEEDRLAANRPLTPEEKAQKKRLEEARLKADLARKAALDAARKATEAKRLQDSIDFAKRSAEDEKRRLEDAQKAEALRQQLAADDAKKAEEIRKQAAAAVQAQAVGLKNDCDAVMESADRASRAVLSALASSETAAQNIENQHRAARTRLEVMTRQIAAKQQLLNSIPIDMRYFCPNLICGKFPPTPVAQTTARTCSRCKTALQQKDFNQERRDVATADLNKTQQAMALEQQRAQTIPVAGGQDDTAKYQAQKGLLDDLKKTVAGIKEKLGEESPNVVLLGQELTRCKGDVDRVLASLPEDLMRIASAPVARTEPAGPAAPRKIYKLKDGRSIEVASEMVAGDELILKTLQGEMVTVNKSEIESSNKK